MFNYCIQKLIDTLIFIKELAIEIGKYDLEKGSKWTDYI